MLQDLFGATGDVSWTQEAARAALVFVYGFLLVRVAGRRVFGKWSALDIVVSIMVGSNLSRALTGNAPLFGTFGATTLLIALHWILAQAVARSERLSRLFEGTPVRLGEGGQVDQRQLRRMSVSVQDLEEAFRQAGLQSRAQSGLVMLEPSGKISVLKQAV